MGKVLQFPPAIVVIVRAFNALTTRNSRGASSTTRTSLSSLPSLPVSLFFVTCACLPCLFSGAFLFAPFSGSGASPCTCPPVSCLHSLSVSLLCLPLPAPFSDIVCLFAPFSGAACLSGSSTSPSVHPPLSPLPSLLHLHTPASPSPSPFPSPFCPNPVPLPSPASPASPLLSPAPMPLLARALPYPLFLLSVSLLSLLHTAYISPLLYGVLRCWFVYLISLFHAEASQRTRLTCAVHEKHILGLVFSGVLLFYSLFWHTTIAWIVDVRHLGPKNMVDFFTGATNILFSFGIQISGRNHLNAFYFLNMPNSSEERLKHPTIPPWYY